MYIYTVIQWCLILCIFQIEKPIYGDKHPSFTNFMAPGIIIRYVYMWNQV